MSVEQIFFIIFKNICFLGSSYDPISFPSSQGTISTQRKININIKKFFFFVFIPKNKRNEKITKSNQISMYA
jgi:hypothetical protein